MNKTITLPQAIQPNTRPCCKIVSAKLIISHSESNKSKLFNESGNIAELELLGLKIEVAAPMGLSAGLVLALALVAIVALVMALRGVNVQLNFDVGLEALGGFLVRWKWDGLGG